MMRSHKGMLVCQPSINDLPEAILVHILSFLPLEETVKTSVLAQSWRNQWLSVPALSFDMNDFQKKISKESNLSFNNKIMAGEKSSLDICEQFCEFISNTLRNRPQHLALTQLKLRSRENPDTLEYIDSWLQLLIPAKVVELDLEFVLFRVWNSTLFFHESVEVLKLAGVEFIFPKEAFPLRLESNIREVHLNDFCSTDKDIADMLASCVHLETLSLGSCTTGLVNLKIESQKLKHLKLEYLNWTFNRDGEFSVEICAPSLISLDLNLVYANKFAVKGLSSLAKALILQNISWSWFNIKYWSNIVSCLSGVERLTTETIWPYDRLQPQDQVLSEAFVFRNLKHVDLLFQFRIDDILGMESILKRCPQLATMVLNIFCGPSKLDSRDFPKDVVFHVPRLRLVEIKFYMKTEVEMYIVDLLKKHGLVLEKIVA